MARTSNKKLFNAYLQTNLQYRFVIAVLIGLFLIGLGVYNIYSTYRANLNLPSGQQPKSYASGIVFLIIAAIVLAFGFVTRSFTKSFYKSVL